MKIGLVCDWYQPRVGGMEVHLEALAARLAAAGHEATVITPTAGPAGNAGPVRVVRVPGWHFPFLGVIWTPAAYRRLNAAIRDGGFDVVHVHSSIGSPAGYMGLLFAHRLGCPSVLTVHSLWGRYRLLPRVLELIFGWTRWPVVFSGVSALVAGHMRPLLGGTPIPILPNAVDPGEWRLPHRDGGPGVVVVACAMRLAVRKRGRALLDVLPGVLRRLPPDVRLKVRIAGDGPARAALERRARSLGLREVVEFLGTIDRENIRDLLAGSDFFVLPTELEAFGIAALEARAAGLPVVAMRAGGVAGFVVHGENGLLAGDDHELGDHLARLASDRELRERIAANNRAAPVEFTWERSLAAHLQAYERARLLRRPARS